MAPPIDEIPLCALFIFKLPGLALLVISGGLILLIEKVTPLKDEDLLTILIGVFAIVGDAAYRMWWGGRDFFNTSAGGHFFWLPVWLLGVIWILLGVCRWLW